MRSFEGQLSNVEAKCVEIKAFFPAELPKGPWTYFSNCDKLEINFERVNEKEEKIGYHNLLKLVKHPNLHVRINEPFRVSDANVKWNQSISDDDYWTGRYICKFYDVESFINRIAVSSIKTMTYLVCYFDRERVTFNCDEQFPFSFMDFLKTKPIYCGNDEEEDYLTLELAKDSFPLYPYFKKFVIETFFHFNLK